MNEIRRFTGYQAIQEEPRLLLPVGGYIAQIQDVRIDTPQFGNSRLVFRVEIVEGPYTNFFTRDYESRKGGAYEAKYRGVYSIPIPNDNVPQQNRGDVDRFNLMMGAIEASNPEYKFDWNADKLKGKWVGISVREKEYRGVVFTEIGKFIPLQIIRSGHFRPMARRVSQDNTTSYSAVQAPSSSYNTSGIPGTNQYMAAHQEAASLPAPHRSNSPQSDRVVYPQNNRQYDAPQYAAPYSEEIPF